MDTTAEWLAKQVISEMDETFLLLVETHNKEQFHYHYFHFIGKTAMLKYLPPAVFTIVGQQNYHGRAVELWRKHYVPT